MTRELNFGRIIRNIQRVCETDQNIIVSALIMTNYDGNASPVSRTTIPYKHIWTFGLWFSSVKLWSLRDIG